MTCVTRDPKLIKKLNLHFRSYGHATRLFMFVLLREADEFNIFTLVMIAWLSIFLLLWILFLSYKLFSFHFSILFKCKTYTGWNNGNPWWGNSEIFQALIGSSSAVSSLCWKTTQLDKAKGQKKLVFHFLVFL